MGEETHHLKDDDANPDREGHRQAAHDGQAGILHEHPAAEFQVHGPAGEPPEHPGFALMFLHLLDAAECPQGGVARLLRVHAPRDVLILEQLQVRADLARQLPFGAARAKRRQQAEDGVAHELSSRVGACRGGMMSQPDSSTSCLHWTCQWRMPASHWKVKWRAPGLEIERPLQQLDALVSTGHTVENVQPLTRMSSGELRAANRRRRYPAASGASASKQVGTALVPGARRRARAIASAPRGRRDSPPRRCRRRRGSRCA